MPVKQNICPPAMTLAYSLKADPDDEDAAAVLEWEGAPVEGIRADSILGSGVSSGDCEEQKDAADFLRELLHGDRMEAVEVYKAAKANGYSSSTIDRAKRRVGVTTTKVGFRPSQWYWQLRRESVPGGTASIEERADLDRY
jgi:hypothetical protein